MPAKDGSPRSEGPDRTSIGPGSLSSAGSGATRRPASAADSWPQVPSDPSSETCSQGDTLGNLASTPRSQGDDPLGGASAPHDDAEVARLVELAVRTRQQIAALEAFELRIYAAAATIADKRVAALDSRDSREAELPLRDIAAEFGAALCVTDRTMQSRLYDAQHITTGFPVALGALHDGRIARAHLREIVEAGARIEDDDARELFQHSLITFAQTDTPARLRAKARALAERLSPRTIDERHRDARNERCVIVRDAEDGMADLYAHLPAALAYGIRNRLSEMARAIKDNGRASGTRSDDRSTDGRAPDTRRSVFTGSRTAPTDETSCSSIGGAVDVESEIDPRSMDHLRADIFADLLLTGVPTSDEKGTAAGLAAITATVQVTLPVRVLITDRDQAPNGVTIPTQSEPTCGGGGGAWLHGYGPIDSDTARALAGQTPGWDRIFTRPDTGEIVAVDRYRPSEAQQRFLRARDVHCRFPGCRSPLPRCDIDHTHPAALGGETAVTNLAHLCRRHHTLKHHTAWKVKHRPGGVLDWRSPTGRTYVDSPTSRVQFTETTTVPAVTTHPPDDDIDPPPF